MLNTSDALSAHAHCKERIAALLEAGSTREPFFCELASDQQCPLTQFLHENADDPRLEAEIARARIAHASMHCAIIDLAQKQQTGEEINIAAEFGRDGAVGAASSALIDSLYRLEHQLHELSN